LRQQTIQKPSGILSEGALDDRGKLLLSPIDRAEDELRQPRVARHFDLLADQRIDTEPEHEFGFELGAHHAGDLFEQQPARLWVKDTETVERSDRNLVELAGARVIVAKVESGILKLELPRHILEVPPVEGARREESFRCFEVARAQQKAQLMGWGAKVTCGAT
jgi:hypothetical protein